MDKASIILQASAKSNGVSAVPRKMLKSPLKASTRGVARPAKPKLERSTLLEIFDIPQDLLVDSPENPNEQDEQTFDQLVEGMRRDGFDEPIIVVPGVEGSPYEGKYIIVSGHHRVKAAKVVGLPACPAKIHENWDDMRRKLELVRRNKLRGSINVQKFTELYDSVRKSGMDTAVIKMQMGITSEAAFKQMYKAVSQSLPPAARAKLEEAKEEIRSVDDLSNVIHKIFKEHGSDLDNSFIVFSRGGKEHMMVQTDPALWHKLQEIQEKVRGTNKDMVDVFKKALESVAVDSVPPSDKVAERRKLRDTA